MKVYKTKNGQPYIKLKSGRAKFIKKKGAKKRSSSVRASYTVKKKTKRRTMAKKKSYRRSKSSGILGNLNKPLMGAAGVVVYESFISPMVPVQGVAKDMLELVGGLWLSKKQGFIGATGKSLVVINSYQLLSGMVGNKLQGIMGGSSADSTNPYAYNY